MVLAWLAADPAAHAAGRRFEPVPQSQAQIVQIVNDSAIISAAGKHMDAGASMAPASARQAWLSVSVKNKSAAPVGFGDGAIQVLSDDKVLALRSAEDALKSSKDDGYVRDRCANATASSQLNCNIDWFNQRQAKRIEKTSDADQPALQQQLEPGQLLARQFQVDLPKKSSSGPTTLRVSVTLAGEQLSFDFREVE